MDFEILSWFGNLVNFSIFLYLTVSIFSSSCFNISQMSISLFGLFVSIMIQAVAVFYRRVV